MARPSPTALVCLFYAGLVPRFHLPRLIRRNSAVTLTPAHPSLVASVHETFLGGTCFRASDFLLRQMGHAEACPSDYFGSGGPGRASLSQLAWRFSPSRKAIDSS